MITAWLLSALGLLILLLAGDALVKGAVTLSLRIGIPALIVSLTIVAFGTSAPELLVSVKAVMEGVPGLALGNVVGSNTVNILLVMGVPALLATMHTSECNTRKSYNHMIAATVLFIGLAYRGVFDWIAAIVLLMALTAMLLDAARDALAHRSADAASGAVEEEEVEGLGPDMPGWRIGLFLALGLVGLPLGASLLVDNATVIAREFDVSDTVIGLTLVAIGTSLPELATTVVAALRRQADVAMGNVIGSNLFNLLGIIGIAGLVGPIEVDPAFLQFDLWVMLGASLLLIPFVYWGQNITRIWGIALTALYATYLFVVLAG